jgi:hypothetical protein
MPSLYAMVIRGVSGNASPIKAESIDMKNFEMKMQITVFLLGIVIGLTVGSVVTLILISEKVLTL